MESCNDSPTCRASVTATSCPSTPMRPGARYSTNSLALISNKPTLVPSAMPAISTHSATPLASHRAAPTGKSKSWFTGPAVRARLYVRAAQSYLWELPAGRVDKGETELAAAKRELLEETGYTAARWQRILKFYVSPGFMDETMTVYLARGLKPGTAQPEDDEIIRKRLVPLSTALRMALKGTIRDSKTISAILWLAWHKSAGKARE